MMNSIVALVAGLLIGWLVEWLIDWFYWRRRGSAAGCEEQLAAARSEAQALQEKVSQLEADLGLARAQAIPLTPPVPDPLEEIQGIGPVIAERLNQHGIYTFEQLAAQEPGSLSALLGDQIQRLADEESWIEQARQLARQKQDKAAGGQ
jgi:branched-chain amino acid transport system ATP-binding protein